MRWWGILVLLVIPVTVSAATTQVSCLTSSTTVRAAQRPSKPLAFQNLDTSNPVYVCNAATCTATTGIKIAPATTTGINGFSTADNEWNSAISCLGVNGTVIITYTVSE